MKILLLIDALSPGGAETHVLTLAHGLISRGHSVAVLSDGGALEASDHPPSLRFFRPRRPFSRGRFAIGNLFDLLRLQKRESFDVLHAHTRKTAFLLRLFRLFFRPRLPRISGRLPYRKRSLRRACRPALAVTCHAKFEPRFRRLSYWGERTAVVSEDLRVHLKRAFGVPEKRVAVVENGVDLARFRPSDRGEDGRLRLVFASRLDNDCSSAARLLLDRFGDWRRRAAARGKTLTLTIMGGGECFEEVRQTADKINRSPGGPCVFALGATADVETELAKGDLFIGVSRAAIEAMCCGLGVILAGDEGFGSLLLPENFDRLAKGNFCCRGERNLDAEALDAAFDAWLGMTREEQDENRRLIGGAARARYDSRRMAKAAESVYLDVFRRRPPLRVLLFGYAGCGNLGDDAILRSLLERWHQKRAPLDLSRRDGMRLPVYAVLTAAVGTLSPPENVPTVNRRRPLDVWRTLLRSDALVLGGGCLLQTVSRRGRRSLSYYLAVLFAARLCGCPYYLTANGIGPLEGGLCRALAGLSLRGAVGISVRDERSRRLALSLGVSERRLSRENDPALSLCLPSENERKEVLFRLLDPRARAAERWVCVVPKRMDGERLDRLVQALKRGCRREGIYPLFVAFDRVRDAQVCRCLRERVGSGQVIVPGEAREVLALFSSSRGVISGRLHGLILASAAGVEGVALDDGGRDRKTADFAERMGWQTVDFKEGAVLILPHR